MVDQRRVEAGQKGGTASQSMRPACPYCGKRKAAKPHRCPVSPTIRAEVDSLRTELAAAIAQRDQLMNTLETRVEREVEMVAQIEKEFGAQLAAAQAERDEAQTLTRENGSFKPVVYEQVLLIGECHIGGHFKFQENGGHCLMCQRDQRLVADFRTRALELVRKKAEEWEAKRNKQEPLSKSEIGRKERQARHTTSDRDVA